MSTKSNLRDLENSTTINSIVVTNASNIAEYKSLPASSVLATDANGAIIAASGVVKKFTMDFISTDWAGGDTLVIPAATHGISSKSMIVKVYEVSGGVASEVATPIDINVTTYGVTLKITSATFGGYVTILG